MWTCPKVPEEMESRDGTQGTKLPEGRDAGLRLEKEAESPRHGGCVSSVSHGVVCARGCARSVQGRSHFPHPVVHTGSSKAQSEFLLSVFLW